jgi:hypothetical protein
MGYAVPHPNRGHRHHIVPVITGFEVTALCGTIVVRFATNHNDGKPIPFADHWLGVGTCQHCKAVYERRRS